MPKLGTISVDGVETITTSLPGTTAPVEYCGKRPSYNLSLTGGPAPKSYPSQLCSGMAACPETGASAAADPAPSAYRNPRRFKIPSLPLLRFHLDQEMLVEVNIQCRRRTLNRTKILTV